MFQQLLVHHLGAHATFDRGVRLVGKEVGQISPRVIVQVIKLRLR